MKELRDKVAVVTGGSGGIGIEIGRAMLSKGMKVVLADLSSEKLDAVTRELASPDVVGLPVDVTDFDAYTGDENFLERRGAVKDDDEKYTREIPDLDEYTKDPPPLPPHLRHIILNKAPPSGDPNALPVPQHVALNHLYCTAIKDGMMVLGVTLRYRQKACTTVYYSVS